MSFFFQAEDGIRVAQESRGLGDVYKRQLLCLTSKGVLTRPRLFVAHGRTRGDVQDIDRARPCLLYTSDAADDLLCVDLGGRRFIKQKTQ